MRITLTSVLVDDQDKVVHFYTGILGFQKKTEVPLGEHPWLTVVSPDDPDGTELVLEPDTHPAARADELSRSVYGVRAERAKARDYPKGRLTPPGSS